MVFKHEIFHEEVVNGLVYRTLRDQEEVEAAVDFYFDVFLKGDAGSQSYDF
jgi:hypothetical protein